MGHEYGRPRLPYAFKTYAWPTLHATIGQIHTSFTLPLNRDFHLEDVDSQS